MKKPYWILNSASDDTAEILLYGYIGYEDGATASSFVKELKELEKSYSNIHVRINSGGGSIYEGFVMYNALRNCKANVETFIDGVAASMATVVFMAGKKRWMSKVSRFMSHRATGGAYGNAADLREMADLMEGLEQDIASIYAGATGLTVEAALKKYIGKDRWLTADQAKKEKLVHGIYDAEPVSVPENITNPQMLVGIYQNALDNKATNEHSTIIII